MISFKDFEDEKGNINWSAFRKAKVDGGESCEKCGSFIFPSRGYRDRCRACRNLEEKTEEVEHEHYIRCPKCGYFDDVHDDHYGLFEEGEHVVCCVECDHEYLITTHVQFHFTSPPRLKEEKEVEEDDDNSVDDETEGGT